MNIIDISPGLIMRRIVSLFISMALIFCGVTSAFAEDLSSVEESSAEIFSEPSSGTVTVRLGDVDLDRSITAADARLALRISARLYVPAPDIYHIADYDRDSFVTAADARSILRISARLEPESDISMVAEVGSYFASEPNSSSEFASEAESYSLAEQTSFYEDPETTTVNEPESTSIVRRLEYSFDDSRVYCSSAVLFDSTTGQFLYQKNAHTRREPASMTKLMTAYVSSLYFSPDDIITVGDEQDHVEYNTSSAGIYKGQSMTYKNMLYCMMLPSGCDAAYALAANTVYKAAEISGADPADISVSEALDLFMEGMNTAAQNIGMNDSHFACPDGYPTSNHYSTAYDMALLARVAFARPVIREVVSTPTAAVYNADGSYFDTFTNTNELIVPGNSYYLDYARGIKTGWHSGAGYCLTAAAIQPEGNSERILYAVVMGCATKYDRFVTLKYLFDTAFAD